MNIEEINGGTPRWTAVVAIGLPLALVTVALPLGFSYEYRRIAQLATRMLRLFKGLVLGGSLLIGTAVSVIIAIVVVLLVVK